MSARRTILIQQGDIGPVRIVTEPLDRLPRLLRHWQGGSLQPLRVRAVHDSGQDALLAAVAPYRQHRDWYGAHAARTAAEKAGPGLAEIAAALDADHQATLSPDQGHEQARLAGWAS